MEKFLRTLRMELGWTIKNRLSEGFEKLACGNEVVMFTLSAQTLETLRPLCYSDWALSLPSLEQFSAVSHEFV